MEGKDKIASKFDLSKLNAACLSKTAEAVAALLDDSAIAQNETDEEGRTAVHYACQNKREGAAILKLLVSRGFSLELLTNNGSSPLHEACRNGNNDAVQLILKHLRDAAGNTDLNSVLGLQNKEGNTALHLVCRGGHVNVVNTLMTICGFAEHDNMRKHCVCTNVSGATPMGLAIGGEHLDTARLLFDFLPSGNPAVTLKDFHNFCPHSQLVKSFRPIECEPMNVFFLGDSGSGKSTLIKTLQAHSQSTLSALYTLLPYVSHAADKHRVGIIPNVIEYPRHHHQCPIIFHDVTGHRNYAHEAIFKCAENPLESLYLVTVDVRATEEAIKSKILYWLHFLSYALSQYLAKRSPTSSDAKLYVMVIGTFNDQMPRFSGPQVMLTTLCRLITDENPELLSHFEWKGSYSLNTRRAYSWKMIQLRSVLQEHCQKVHLCADPHDSAAERLLPAQSYVLAAAVSNLLEETSTDVVSFKAVIEHVKNSDTVLSKLLRKSDGDVDRVALMDLCQRLKQFSQFSIYSDSHSSPSRHKSFIILNLHQVLSNINAAIDNLPHTHGIVSHTKVHEAFEEFNFPSGFIIEFMESFQICEGVTASGLKHMREEIRTSRRSLTSMGSFRSTSRPHLLKQSESCETPIGSMENLARNNVQTRRTLSTPINIDIATIRDITSPTLVVVNPSPTGSTQSIEDHKQNGTSSPHPGSLSHSRPHRHSSYRNRHGRQRNIPYCFFPTLIPSQPPDKWESDYDKYSYGFAWSLCPSEGQYFPPRFVTNLLFRLLHGFAPYKTEHVYQHEKVCDLWSCGIMWQDHNGIRACVAVHDNQSIILSMQCLKSKELDCLKLRNQVIAEIAKHKHELHPKISFSEILIPDDRSADFPIHNPADASAWYDKMEIGRAIMSNESTLNCTKRKQHVVLTDLLFFEPLSILPPPLLHKLLDETIQDEKMSEEFVLDLAKEISDKWQLLAQYFDLHPSFVADVERGTHADNLAPYWAARELVERLESLEPGHGVQTYGELAESLMEISIFNERDLQSLANSKKEFEESGSDGSSSDSDMKG